MAESLDSETPVKLVDTRKPGPWNGTAGPGRPKGSVPKITQEVRAAARALLDDPAYKDSLRTRLIAGTAPHMETLLWHYSFGKPTERVEIEGTVTLEKIVREVIRAPESNDIIEIDAVH
jgi:hypothetical protein